MIVAFPVAKFTLAATPSIAASFFCTRAAHAAHVIPRTDSSTSIRPGGGALPATAADDIQPALPSNCPARASRRRTGAVAGLRVLRIPPHRKIYTGLKGACNISRVTKKSSSRAATPAGDS